MLNLTGCSLSFERKNYLTEKSNDINLEIIKNYSKAISRDPSNSFFYFERARAKEDYGDFEGAIEDYNNSFKINQDLKAIFYRANSKYKYGDFEGAIIDYEKLNLFEKNKDQIFYNLASAQLLHFDYQKAINIQLQIKLFNISIDINYDY